MNTTTVIPCMVGIGHFVSSPRARKRLPNSITAKRVTIIGATNVLSLYCVSVEVVLIRFTVVLFRLT